MSFTSLLTYWHLQYLRSRVELYITVTVLTFTVSEKQDWALHHCYRTDIYSIWEAGLSFTSLLPYWHLQYLRSRVELYITVTVLTFTVSEKQGWVYITVTVLTFTVSEKQGWVYITVTVLTFTVSEKQGWALHHCYHTDIYSIWEAGLSLHHCYRTDIYSIWEAGLSFISLLLYWHLQYLRSRVEFTSLLLYWHLQYLRSRVELYITVTVLTFTVSEKQGWALYHCYCTDIYSIWEAGLSFISLLPYWHLQYLRSRVELYITVTVLTFTVSEKQGWALYHCYRTDIYSIWEAGSSLHHCYCTDMYSIWEAGLSFTSLLPYLHLQYLRSRIELYITVTVLTFTVSEKQDWALHHCYCTDIYSIWEAGLSLHHCYCTDIYSIWEAGLSLHHCYRTDIYSIWEAGLSLHHCYRTDIYSIWEAGLSFISLLPYLHLQYLRSRVELYITVTVLTFTVSEKQGWALYHWYRTYIYSIWEAGLSFTSLLPYLHLQYLRSRVELYITVTVLTFTVSEKQGRALHHCYCTDIYHLQFLRSRVELYITVTVLTFTVSEKQGWALHHCYRTDIYSIWEAGLSFTSLLPYWHLQYLRSRVELYITVTVLTFTVSEKQGWALHHCYRTDIYSIWEAGLSFTSLLLYWHLQYMRSRVVGCFICLLTVNLKVCFLAQFDAKASEHFTTCAVFLNPLTNSCCFLFFFLVFLNKDK